MSIRLDFDKGTVNACMPLYEPPEVTKCEKCGKAIAEPKELIGIQKKHQS